MATPTTRRAAQTGWLCRFRALILDTKGAGAVEFALIVPLLIFLYITAFELTIALSVSKRTASSASTIADITTQQASVTPTWLATMKDVTGSIFAPYAPQNLSLKITGVQLDANSNPTVAWSWDQSNGKPYAVGSTVNVPSDMRTASTFLVRTELSVTHKLLMIMPGLLPPQLQTITLSRQYYYRQRVGTSIDCNGC
ncbi:MULTISPECIES: TadE/TadG family type IV pilus assembly protein [unclassified Rhizobium]|jgi:Flp pilus assembly protein TadG|uniref:TadE/TadG family type IV pilus assembly protein n=1 Tax=Rhizobium/Agrobacterium group TaxID=227290 RepID=UPI0008A7EC6D|nr:MULTISPECIES: TadE/TadG family type IV pilus assembly protein [unclassified Rhizobium]MBD8665073.1 pilus assembly protein [Rhizobium sp. CFBP 8752]SEH28827.1 Flp pilus assembly protein TadG [Rhizobium sp. NFR12]